MKAGWAIFCALGALFAACSTIVRCLDFWHKPHLIHNSFQVAQFYGAVIDLMYEVQSNESNIEYMNYFDRPIREEIDHIFARLRGYAANESQAAEWERFAHEYVRVYLVHTCAEQAREYSITYSILHSSDIVRVPSLQLHCINQISNDIFSQSRENFIYPSVSSAVFGYELNRLQRFSVAAFYVNPAEYDEPSLILRLRSSSGIRFLDERMVPHGELEGSYIRDPVPLSPRENLFQELRFLRRAQNTVIEAYKNFDFPLTYGTHDLSNIVDESLHNYTMTYISTLLRNLGISPTTSWPHDVIQTAFLNILERFLYSELQWIICHPLFGSCEMAREPFTRQVRQIQQNLMNGVQQAQMRCTIILNQFQLGYLMRMLEMSIQQRVISVGYSIRRSRGVAIVDHSAARPEEPVEQVEQVGPGRFIDPCNEPNNEPSNGRNNVPRNEPNNEPSGSGTSNNSITIILP